MAFLSSVTLLHKQATLQGRLQCPWCETDFRGKIHTRLRPGPEQTSYPSARSPVSQGEAGVATVRDPRAPTAGPAPPSLGAGLQSTCRTPPEPPHERVTCAPLQPHPPAPPVVPAAPAAATWAPGGLSSPGPWAWTLATRSSVASPRPVLPVLPLASRTDQRPSASVRRWRAPSPRIPARPAAAPQAGFPGLPSPPLGDKRFSSRLPPRACFLRQPRKRYLESSPHQTPDSICPTHPEGQICTSGFLFVWFGLRLSLSIYPGAHSVDKAGLEHTEIHQPLPPECWY